MNQTTTLNPLRGALYMVLAGICFAAANAVTWTVTFKLGFKPQSDAFWQYAIALVFFLPFLWKQGLATIRSHHPYLHLLRIALSALGVQAFVASFSVGLPIWHVVALVMTSPFFVLIGATLFLGETIAPNRWIAASIAFVGAMTLLQPWQSGLQIGALYPVAAAILWGAASLITKRLTREESQNGITLWLLLLLTPINFAISLHAGFEVPTGVLLALLIAGGVILFAAQHLLTLSYANADAGFVQPFDDLKLLSNIAVSWAIFGDVPTGPAWAGVALILAGSAYLLISEPRAPQIQPQPA